MVSVVMVHVLVSGFGLNPNQSALAILRGTFTLPLFFFVSGFFLYRRPAEWDDARILHALRVRGMALVGGTALFATLFFLVMKRPDPLCWLHYGDFVEYWYTISLFQIFIWYLVAVCVGKICGAVAFRALAFTAMAASAVLPFTPWAEFYWCSWALNEKTALYFQFFALGMIARRWQEPFFALLSRPWTLTALITVYVASLLGGWTYAEFWQNHWPPMLTLLREEVARYAGVLLVLRIFHDARATFDRTGSPFAATWLLIGRRTLDIYFLHYFFIPRMRWVGTYLLKGNTFVPEFIAAAIVAAAVLAIVLPLSALLRRAPLLRRLLGAKPATPGN